MLSPKTALKRGEKASHKLRGDICNWYTNLYPEYMKNYTSVRKTKNLIEKLEKDLRFQNEDIQIGNKHMKKCSTSLITTEMQIKTIIRCHYHPSEWLKLKGPTIPRVGWGCVAESKLVQLLCKIILHSLLRLNIWIPHDLANPLLDI